ncbi:MAG: redoxin domain-containing protein, partial [Blastocatellia bacterium]|nr:redoxin domain-containing protein [Blastocatellia bacterium]
FGQIHSEPVGRSSIIRNVGFLILALFLAVQGSDFQGAELADTSAGMVQAILVLLIALLAATAIFLLLRILENQTAIVRRLDVIEVLANDGVVVDRQEAGSPEDALPIGAPFPDFELSDTKGVNVRFDHLLSRGKGMLFLFVSPDCGPCRELAPSVAQWREELADKLSVIVVSRGAVADNIEKFGNAAATYLLVQKKRELADDVMAKWTPTAIYVDADGDIASHPAVGDEAIRALVTDISGADLDKEFVFFANSNGHRKPLKIGEKVPEFALEALGEGQLTDEHLTEKRTMIISWSLSCSHCRAMVDEIREWETTRAPSDPEVLILSGSKREDHKDIELETPIFLDPSHTVAATLGLRGTPSAVLIDEGTIITEAGIGSRNIWSLIGRKK